MVVKINNILVPAGTRDNKYEELDCFVEAFVGERCICILRYEDIDIPYTKRDKKELLEAVKRNILTDLSDNGYNGSDFTIKGKNGKLRLVDKEQPRRVGKEALALTKDIGLIGLMAIATYKLGTLSKEWSKETTEVLSQLARKIRI